MLSKYQAVGLCLFLLFLYHSLSLPISFCPFIVCEQLSNTKCVVQLKLVTVDLYKVVEKKTGTEHVTSV